jgi:hypothetical protein
LEPAMVLSELSTFLLGAILNIAVALVIVRGIYYRATRDKSFVLSYLSISAVIFFLLQFLTGVELSLGFGLGLFAIFSVLRYRTDEVAIREMAYLFVVIGLAVMNSFLRSTDDLVKLLIANGTVIALLYVLEREWGFKFEASKRVIYEMIELITPANRELLLADLRKRTGLPVKRAEVVRIDFLRDTAELKIFYDEPGVGRRAVTATAQIAQPDGEVDGVNPSGRLTPKN